MSTAIAKRPAKTIQYAPLGAAKDLFECRDKMVCIEGPAGTGKTFAVCQKEHLALSKYPGIKSLMLRKTFRSLKSSALATYQDKVLRKEDGVRLRGETTADSAHFLYPNGSKLYFGGLDNVAKLMSSDYDRIYLNEAIDAQLSDLEMIDTRLRHNKMPYQQLTLDCNPDAPSHWLNQLMNQGRITRLISKFEDNPTVTQDYMDRLDNLTGVRYLRLRKGFWAAAEGLVYEDNFNAADTIINSFEIPKSWTRYLSIDFGYTHPFVCQWWAEDPDGRLYMYREIYRTKRLVEDHAKDIIALSNWDDYENGDPLPVDIITDHDAEDRATLEYHLGRITIPAYKNVSAGIQAVSARLKKQGDNKQRLFYFRDACQDKDAELIDARKPSCGQEEWESYIWDIRTSIKKDVPVKDLDHAMDTTRYMIAYKDLQKNDVSYIKNPWS